MLKRLKNKVSSFTFKPFSLKQKRLLMWWTKGSPHFDKEIVIASGAIRAGKTISMIDSFLTWSLSVHKNKNFIIAGKSMGSLKRNVLQPLFQILVAKGIQYHYHRSGEPHIVIGTNTYWLFGANNESSQDVLQGLTASGTYLDEVVLFPQSFVMQAMGRCSDDSDGMPRHFFNCNPSSPYHWLKLEFIDKAIEKKVYYLHFTMDDNPSLSERIREAYKSRFSGVFYLRNILGLWVLAEGLVHSVFDKDKHVVETVERPYTQYYVSCDYGTQNPTAMGLWGLYDGIWYKIKEYHYDGRKSSRQKTDDEYLQDLIKFVDGLPIKGVIIDPSAASFIAAIRKTNMFYVIKADNKVLDGIRDVGTAISTGRVLYNNCCKETFREFASYRWDEKAITRGEDKVIKDNDHHMDGDRYFIRKVIMSSKTITFA